MLTWFLRMLESLRVVVPPNFLDPPEPPPGTPLASFDGISGEPSWFHNNTFNPRFSFHADDHVGGQCERDFRLLLDRYALPPASKHFHIINALLWSMLKACYFSNPDRPLLAVSEDVPSKYRAFLRLLFNNNVFDAGRSSDSFRVPIPVQPSARQPKTGLELDWKTKKSFLSKLRPWLQDRLNLTRYPNPGEEPYLLFVTRRRSVRVFDEKKLLLTLLEKMSTIKVKKVTLESLSVRDSFQMLYGATGIVLAHGAAEMNLIAREDGAVVEVCPQGAGPTWAGGCGCEWIFREDESWGECGSRYRARLGPPNSNLKIIPLSPNEENPESEFCRKTCALSWAEARDSGKIKIADPCRLVHALEEAGFRHWRYPPQESCANVAEEVRRRLDIHWAESIALEIVAVGIILLMAIRFLRPKGDGNSLKPIKKKNSALREKMGEQEL